MNRKVCSGTLLALALLALAGPLAADRTVRVGVFSAPPLVQIDGGEPRGLFIDLIRHFASVGQWKVVFVPAPWSQQLKALERGEIDLLPAIGFTQPRQALYDFSRDPVFIDSGVLFSGPNLVIHTLFDLQGKRVAALDTSVFTEAFRANMALFGISCQVVPMANNEAVMEAIVAGTADAGVSIYSLGTYLARRYKVAITPISFSPIALEFAVPKGKGADVLAVIDAEMGSMRSDPASLYAQAYKKWILPAEGGGAPLWLWWSLGGLAVFGLLAMVWIGSLRRVVNAQTKSLVEEKTRLTVTLRSLADGVITSDTGGLVQLMNPVAEHLCGWTQKEAHQRPIESVFVVVFEGDRAYLVARQGSRLRIATTEAPILDDAGQTLGTVRTFRDITDQERLAESLQRNDKLDSLGVLAGGIAHDFNNLLAGMFGFVDLAIQAGPGEKALGYLEKAKSVFQRAKALTYQLLTFSRGGSPNKAPCDLSRLLRASASFAGAGSNVRVELIIPSDLWICEVDENQVGQVFDNLIINARQAMPDGGVLRITAENLAGAAGRLVSVSFADQGLGIAPEVQPKIFAPFFTTKPAGHGLGLATARSIITKHGGSLDFRSSPAGTTFRLVLPAVPGRFDDEPREPLGTLAGTGVIAVLDDEEFLRTILTELLTSVGYEVVVASQGEELLSRLGEDPGLAPRVKAFFLDLTIPGGMGGLETVTRLRSLLPDVPIFASSGFSDDPVMANPGAFGFTSCIRKPYTAEELFRLLSKHL